MSHLPGSLRLNTFQTVIRQWEAMHPHNAVQFMQVAGVADLDACEFTWQMTLHELGLGKVSTDGVSYWHEVWDGQPPAPLVQVVESSLEEHLAAALNRGFARNADLPYRPFILQQAESFYMGIVYRQWVADSVSVRLLMREWFLRIFEPHRARRKLVTLIGGSRARGPRLGNSPARLLRVGVEAAKWLSEARRLRQPPSLEESGGPLAGSPPPANVLNVSLRLHPLPHSLINGLLTCARVEGVTFNDLILAVLARALHEVCPASDPARQDLALATSVDLRPYVPADLSEAFGSLLTYPAIVCPGEKLGNFRSLLLHIARQNHALKNFRELAIRITLMRMAAWRTRRLCGAAMLEFYRRRAPLMGASTNVNMNRSWAAAHHPHPILGYHRLSSPSPAMPVVLSATTLGNTCNLALTWRPALLPGDRAESLLQHVSAGLAALTT